MTNPLPDVALLFGIHSTSNGAVVCPGEVVGIGQGAQHPDGPQRMNGDEHLDFGLLGPHGPAPDLRVVEEEELVVAELDARQQILPAVAVHPVVVGPVGLLYAPVVGDVLPLGDPPVQKFVHLVHFVARVLVDDALSTLSANRYKGHYFAPF